MSRSTRTNPAYLELAYRKAIVGELITMLTNEYTKAYSEQARRKVAAEDVYKEDSEVPEEHIHEFITDLQQEEEHLRLELSKFDFVKRENNGIWQHKRLKKEEKDREGDAPKGAEGGGGKAKRRQPEQH